MIVRVIDFDYSFIYSGHFYSAPSSPLLLEALQTTARMLYRVSRRSARVTAGKILAQGPYVAARAGVEPTTLRLKVIVLTKEPPRPTNYSINPAYTCTCS